MIYKTKTKSPQGKMRIKIVKRGKDIKISPTVADVRLPGKNDKRKSGIRPRYIAISARRMKTRGEFQLMAISLVE